MNPLRWLSGLFQISLDLSIAAKIVQGAFRFPRPSSAALNQPEAAKKNPPNTDPSA